jgi:photosynthesis system II assembly factor YCF48-like protein/putative zinc finger protein
MEQLPKIVQRRLQETAKPGVHPDPDLLAAFVEKSLNDRERSQVLQHLSDCADCREVMSLAMPEIESKPSPIPERSRWLTWPVLRWGALAACVVVVSAAVTLHYERRQAGESSVAEKTPAAPASLPAENNASQQPREKLAAKIPPPAPFQSDRDLGVASKLAKQREESMHAGTFGGRTKVFAPRALDQSVRDQKLSNNRLADAVKSADKPAPPSGMIVARGAARVPAAKAEQTAPESEVRNDTVASAPSAITETVTVEGATTSVLETLQTPARKAKDESTKNEEQKEVRTARAGAVGAMATGGRKTDSLSAEVAQAASGDYAKRSQAGRNAPRWTLSADGVLQRSFDSGKTWQAIPVANHVVFRALAANDFDIWVGGAAGALYHSSDAGQHWVHVNPVVDGKPLTADIVTVEFSDTQHGKLTTSDHETWTTSNAGDAWQKH